MRRFVFAAVLFAAINCSSSLRADIVIDLEELSLFTGNSPAGGGQYYNGNNGSNTTNSNGWSSDGVYFGNSYNSDFGGFWNGFSYSNVVNTTTQGFTNQYAAYAPASPGAGAGGSQNYAVAYFGSHAYFNLPPKTLLSSVTLANTTYAALSMLNGDLFAKKFGGPTGNDPDFFRIVLNGFDGLSGMGNSVGAVTIDLADFTFPDNTQDYILDDWQIVDLTSIANARSVSLSWLSSDVGAFGINTPTYVALDNLTLKAIPEPASLALVGFFGITAAWCRRRRQIF